MKMIKFSALILASGLFMASCGNGTENDANDADTTMMEEMPGTQDDADTVVYINNNTSLHQGIDTPATRTFDESKPKNDVDESTVGEPTKNPGKSPSSGHPDRLPDNPSTSSPSM